jgi:alpha-tubulin suppressor-like RCC1 family protein
VEEVPTLVAGLADPVFIDGGLAHGCALRVGGRVSCWGKDDRGQLGPNATGTTGRNTPLGVPLTGSASELAVGGDHNCAIVEGAVWCWGQDDRGQLGAGAAGTAPQDIPALVPDL